jgi:putative DNA primase/helicase
MMSESRLEIFWDSGLMCEKWDEQHFAVGSTYGEKTIERAIAGTSEFYEPSRRPDCNVDTIGATDIGIAHPYPRKRERIERIEELEQRLVRYSKKKPNRNKNALGEKP